MSFTHRDESILADTKKHTPLWKLPSAASVMRRVQPIENASVAVRPTRLQIIVWLVLVALGLGLALRDYDSFQLGVFQDDAAYTILARSLVESPTFGLINSPAQPSRGRYPIGFPLLLAPLVYFFPTQPDVLKLVSLAATLATATLLFWGWHRFSRSTSHWWALALLALYLTFPSTVNLTRMVMSEAVFLAFCLAALFVAERGRARPFHLRELILLSILIFFVIFIRSVGLIFIPMLFAYLLLTRGRSAWRDLVLVSAGVFLVIGVVVAVTPIQPRDLIPTQYFNQFQEMSKTNQGLLKYPRRLATNLARYSTVNLRQVVLPVGTGTIELNIANQLGVAWLPAVFGLAFSALVIVGYWIWIRREGLALPWLFGLIYFLTLLLWPWPLDRFLYPIQPQIFLAIFFSIYTVFAWASTRWRISLHMRRAAIALVLIGFMLINIWRAWRIDSSQLHTGDLAQRTAWLAANAASTAHFLTEQPQTDFLYSGRHTLRYFSAPTPDAFYKRLQQNQIQYVLIAPHLEWQSSYVPSYSNATKRVLAQMQELTAAGRAQLVYEDRPNLIQVYRILP